MFVLGCDVGAMATKTVLLDNGSLAAFNITPNEGRLIEAIERSVADVLSIVGMTIEHVQACGGTGRGDKYISFPHHREGTMNCLARGALWASPETRTIVDMGGLSSTALSINEHGKVLEYRSNDRCAAGTGFFMELAAQALDLALDDFGPMSATAKDRVKMSSQCAVFRESEIVTHMNEGVGVPEIVAGINHSIGTSTGILVRRLGINPEMTVTGGVAKNSGVVKALEENVGTRATTADVDPQLIGAVGAALGAAQKATV